MSFRCALLAFMLLARSAFAQTVVPITGEPDHHLVMSNPYVRVFEVEVPARAETLYHEHDFDYLYVAIGEADVTSTRLTEKPVRVRLKDGEVELAKGRFAHKASNHRDQPFRNVTIELLGGTGSPICGLAGGEKSCEVGRGSSGGTSGTAEASDRSFSTTSTPLLRSSRLAVDRIRLKGHAGADLSLWSRGPSLVIAISAIHLRSASQNSTQVIVHDAGTPVWIPEPNTKLTNLSESAEFILISFSPRPPE